MKKIIFATTNEGKMKEIRSILSDCSYEILSIKESRIAIEIEETGTTFEENAIIKAKAIMQISGEMVLADDSGLEIDYLNKAPGVYSARFLGEDTSYEVKNQYLLDQLKGVPDTLRGARFVSVIACAFPNGEIITTRGTIEGTIAYEAKGSNGFGYDPIFWVPEYHCTSAQLDPDAKNRISHRGKALSEMKQLLKERGV